jgi:D-alanyl-D-alanine carboxypeptidase/D-alanyl-D-alanine-endopeptidase (penicillin-binding protein 4)
MIRCIRWLARSRIVTTCGLALAALVAIPAAPGVAHAAIGTVAVQPPRKRAPTRASSKSKTKAKRSTRATKARVRTPIVPALRYTTPRGADALASDLGTLLSSRTTTGDWGAMVVSLTRGDTLFAQGAGAKLVPYIFPQESDANPVTFSSCASPTSLTALPSLMYSLSPTKPNL